jgi:hypothetical protein
MFGRDVDCALIILQLNSPIHTYPFVQALTFPQPETTNIVILAGLDKTFL